MSQPTVFDKTFGNRTLLISRKRFTYWISNPYEKNFFELLVPWLPPIPLSPFSFFVVVAISTRKNKIIQMIMTFWYHLLKLLQFISITSIKTNTYFEWQWTIDVSTGKIDRWISNICILTLKCLSSWTRAIFLHLSIF